MTKSTYLLEKARDGELAGMRAGGDGGGGVGTKKLPKASSTRKELVLAGMGAADGEMTPVYGHGSEAGDPECNGVLRSSYDIRALEQRMRMTRQRRALTPVRCSVVRCQAVTL